MDRRFLGIDELTEYLGLPKSTRYVWTSQRRIPYLKIGRSLKFDVKEIEEWLKDKRVREL